LALKYDTFRIFTETHVTTFPPKGMHACHAKHLQCYKFNGQRKICGISWEIKAFWV